MKTVYHKADTRGFADHGWLKSHHTFSFANYYNPERMSFGVLRVLNDDQVASGMGFGTHPHRDMEIISIPLEGDLEHKDSMGTTAVIRNGEIHKDENLSWIGAHENYTLTEKDGVTTVDVDIDVDESFQEFMEDAWPKALQALKEISEKGE